MNKIFKILIIFSLIILSKTANARTVGNYLGVDFINTNLDFSSDKKFANKTINSGYTNPASKFSYGLQYGYAVNIMGVFITPTLIYEFNNTRNRFNKTNQYAEVRQDYYGKSFVEVKQRYGAKLNIGYDITNNLGVYGLIGYAVNKYSSYNSIYYDKYYQNRNLSQNPWARTNGKKNAPFFGVGFNIKLYKYWSFNGEYNYTTFKIKSKAKTQDNLNSEVKSKLADGSWHDSLLINYKISIIKFGVNYNF